MLRRHDPSVLALGWQGALAGRSRDRPIARAVICALGLVLGASSGMFLGSVLGIAVALVLVAMAPQLAFIIVMFTTLSGMAAGAVVGPRVLYREAFDETF